MSIDGGRIGGGGLPNDRSRHAPELHTSDLMIERPDPLSNMKRIVLLTLSIMTIIVLMTLYLSL